MKTKRIPALTWVQFLCCLLVVYGHSFPFVTPYPQALEISKRFVYSFHMPVFVFCSGVLLVVSDAAQKYHFPSYLKRRATRLLLPYFVFSLLGIAPKILLLPFLNDKLTLDFWQLLRVFLVPRENIWGHFWFLPMIFACGLVGYWLQKAARRFPWVMLPAVILCIGGFFLPTLTGWLAINDIIHYMLYFVLGMCAAGLCRKAEKVPSRVAYLTGGLSVVLGCTLFLVLYYFSISVSLRGLFVTALMLTGLFLLVLPLSLRHPLKQNSIITRSYSIFILSRPCQLAAEVVLERILHLPYWCIMPPVFAAGVFVPWLMIRLIDRLERNRQHKPLTLLIGG